MLLPENDEIIASKKRNSVHILVIEIHLFVMWGCKCALPANLSVGVPA